MGFADRVIARAAPEQRAITEWGSSAIPGPLGNMAMGGGSYSSVDLRRSEAALQKVAVWSAVDLIAGVASQLPLQTFRMQPDGTGKPITNPKFVDDPAGDGQGTGDWVYQYLGSKLMRGNAYGRPGSLDPTTGNLTQIVLLHPDDVRGSRDPYTGAVTWRVNGVDVPASQMWHRRAYPVAGQLLGLSPVGQHATTIGQGIAAARFGMQFFSDGGHPSSMLHNTEEEIDQTKATIVKARWMSTVWGSREPIVMGRGWEYKPLSVAPNESQFLETQKFTGAECCRIFGPNIAEILGYETGGSMTYANQEQRAIDFLKFTLNRWLRDVEAVFTRYLPGPQYVRFDRRVLLETDLISRYQAHRTARDIGLSNIDELRGMEDLSPLPNGQGADYTPLLIQVAASRGIDAAQVHAGEPPADQPVGQRSAEPDPKATEDDLDEASVALLFALYLLDDERSEQRGYDPAKHARIPKGQPGGGRFMSMVDRVKKVLEEHLNGDGKGDPFDGFSREQLRKVAKERGHDLPRGISRDDLAKLLLDDLHKGERTAVAPGLDKPRSTRVPGRDRLDEVVRDLHGQPAAYEGRRRKAYDTPYDAHLQKIVKTQGFDAKPQVVTKEHLDQAVGDGWTEVWRGVMGIPGAKRPADINHDLRYGEFEPGRGIYGNGVYTSVRRVSAEVYRGREPVRAAAPGRDFTLDDLDGEAYPDSLLRMAIDPQAKVVNYDDVKPQLREWRQGVASDSPEALALSDAGRFAAAKGYDVMLVRGHSDGAFYPGWENSTDDDFTGGIGHPDQYVILNRSVVMIQRAEDVP